MPAHWRLAICSLQNSDLRPRKLFGNQVQSAKRAQAQLTFFGIDELGGVGKKVVNESVTPRANENQEIEDQRQVGIVRSDIELTPTSVADAFESHALTDVH